MTDSLVRFSVVVPLYRSARYLPDLLRAFDAQRRGRYELEFIFVDDGSPDDSAQIAERWLHAAARSGRVIRKANGGVSSARNAGIAVAAGDWIALPDGDDFVGDRYFAATADALLAPDSKDAVIAAANVKWFSEAAGRAADTHALKFKFADGTRVIDLDREPQAVQSQAASAFFRRDILQRDDVRFTESLSIAEDALFVAEYLLAAPSRRVLMVSDAEYFYRKRTAADSAVDNSGHDPDFNFGRFERGYLPLFERAESDGNVPAWLDMMFLYDVRWFLPRENDISKKATWMSDADRERVLAALAAVLAHVADSSIHSYNVTSLGVDHRCLLLALKGSPLPAEGIAKVVTDDHRGVEIRYLFARALPVERFAHDGRPVEPVVSKTRRLDVFGQTLVRERILWFAPRSVVTVQLDDHAVALESSVYQARGLRPRPRQRRASSATRAQAARFLRRVAGRARAELAAMVPGSFRSSPRVRGRGDGMRARRWTRMRRLLGMNRKYSDAWVLMDRVSAAGDSAEYLYRHLRRHEPAINAWFVVAEDSADWNRLKREGFRLIAYGSGEHRAVLAEALVVLSTHLDVEETDPVPERHYPGRSRPWRYVYLEHGVLQHDLSIWFNRKRIDLITTASVDEQNSIIEDGSSYVLTGMQAKLTGFPRHDEVARLVAAADPAERNIILLAPTWRHRLLGPKAVGGGRTLREPFERSEFGQNWLALVNDPRLAALAQAAGARIAFLPHPNFRSQIDADLVAPHVDLITVVHDVHELLTRCRVVVTDYSSIFFEAALAGADVAYFQFDRDDFLHGGHTYVPGYWSYEDHGFGPVATSVPDAVEIVRRQLDDLGYLAERDLYRARVERTLPLVDGQSCRRITHQVRDLLS